MSGVVPVPRDLAQAAPPAAPPPAPPPPATQTQDTPPPATTSFLGWIINVFLTLGGLLTPATPTPLVPGATPEATVLNISAGATPEATVLNTSAGAVAPGASTASRLYALLACFGRGDGPVEQEESTSLLPVVVASPERKKTTTTLWKIVRSLLCMGEGDDTPPQPQAPSPGRLSKMGNWISTKFSETCNWISTKSPEYASWEELLTAAKESIDWIISTVFPFVPAKFLAASIVSSIALTINTKTAFRRASSIPLQPAVSAAPAFPLSFLQAVLMYATLYTWAKAFTNGKIRFLVESLSLCFGVAALFYLLPSVHQLEIDFPFAWFGGSAVAFVLVLNIVDYFITPAAEPVVLVL